MPDRQPLHKLVDALPDAELGNARQLLEALCDRAGELEVDAETAEELAEIDEARAEIRRGEWVTLEQIKSENGL